MPAMLLISVKNETLETTQLWEMLVIERGFLSSPSGPKDAYRASPATLPDDMSGPGVPVGKGYETLAVIQIVDRKGYRIGPLGLGIFENGNDEKHAEAEVLKRLAPDPGMKDGKMILVVETPVCRLCRGKLTMWAKRAGITTIDTYVPERLSMTSEKMARPKTSARTATMLGRPPVYLKLERIENFS